MKEEPDHLAISAECTAFEQWLETRYNRQMKPQFGWGHPEKMKDRWHQGCRANEYYYGPIQDMFEAWLAAKKDELQCMISTIDRVAAS